MNPAIERHSQKCRVNTNTVLWPLTSSPNVLVVPSRSYTSTLSASDSSSAVGSFRAPVTSADSGAAAAILYDFAYSGGSISSFCGGWQRVVCRLWSSLGLGDDDCGLRERHGVALMVALVPILHSATVMSVRLSGRSSRCFSLVQSHHITSLRNGTTPW